VKHRFPAVILDETCQLVGKLGTEEGIQTIVGIECIVMPVGAFLYTAVRAAGNAHDHRYDRLAVGKVVKYVKQCGSVLEALGVTYADIVNAQLFGFLLNHF
jgi:hypothetical protein